MKIQLTRNTVVAGVAYEAGAKVEASDRDARYLVVIGKAVPYEGKAPRTAPAEAPAPADVPAADPAPAEVPADELAAEKAEAAAAVISTAVPGGKRPGRGKAGK
jgi:hypothetical protein